MKKTSKIAVLTAVLLFIVCALCACGEESIVSESSSMLSEISSSSVGDITSDEYTDGSGSSAESDSAESDSAESDSQENSGESGESQLTLNENYFQSSVTL